MKKAIFVLMMLFILISFVCSAVQAEDISVAITSDGSESQPRNLTNVTSENEDATTTSGNAETVSSSVVTVGGGSSGINNLKVGSEKSVAINGGEIIEGGIQAKAGTILINAIKEPVSIKAVSGTEHITLKTIEGKAFELNEVKSQMVDQVVKVDLRVSSGEVQILRVPENNELVITSKTEGVQAVTKNDLEFFESKLYIVESTEEKNERYEIKIMPEIAKEAVLKAEPQIVVKALELKVVGDKSVYEVFGAKKVKVLGFIPVVMEVRSTVDAGTSEVVEVEEPWWGVFSVG